MGRIFLQPMVEDIPDEYCRPNGRILTSPPSPRRKISGITSRRRFKTL